MTIQEYAQKNFKAKFEVLPVIRVLRARSSLGLEQRAGIEWSGGVATIFGDDRSKKSKKRDDGSKPSL